MNKLEIETQKAILIEKYGKWSYDIPLVEGVWTKDGSNIPHTRLKRILQIANDISKKPISECRVLDLGCLDGQFAIEFALHGAKVVGIEGRESNIKKAEFAKNVLKLDNLEFIQDDVRNVSKENYGIFDIIICSGILYHINIPDVFPFIENLYEMLSGLLIIDTHISFKPHVKTSYKNKDYFGRNLKEFNPDTTKEEKALNLWATLDNDLSFWFTRPSLINFLQNTGFTSIYECFTPIHKNFGKPGIESKDRCTFLAVKGSTIDLKTSPAATDFHEEWEEGMLSYCAE